MRLECKDPAMRRMAAEGGKSEGTRAFLLPTSVRRRSRTLPASAKSSTSGQILDRSPTRFAKLAGSCSPPESATPSSPRPSSSSCSSPDQTGRRPGVARRTTSPPSGGSSGRIWRVTKGTAVRTARDPSPRAARARSPSWRRSSDRAAPPGRRSTAPPRAAVAGLSSAPPARSRSDVSTSAPAACGRRAEVELLA